MIFSENRFTRFRIML